MSHSAYFSISNWLMLWQQSEYENEILEYRDTHRRSPEAYNHNNKSSYKCTRRQIMRWRVYFCITLPNYRIDGNSSIKCRNWRSSYNFFGSKNKAAMARGVHFTIYDPQYDRQFLFCVGAHVFVDFVVVCSRGNILGSNNVIFKREYWVRARARGSGPNKKSRPKTVLGENRPMNQFSTFRY